MRSRLAALVTASGLLGSVGTARADKTETCLTATVAGQKLQRDGKLMEARERFLTCASSECPADVASRCERWAQGVTDLVPSIVVVARDGKGHDLGGVRVTIDDRPSADLSPRALELDPGEHRVTFERSGSRPIEQRVILHDAEKNRVVLAVFASPEENSASATAPSATAPNATSRPVPARVWIAAGVGLLGFASFGVFAAKGAHDRSAYHCDTGCPTERKNSVDAELRVADISLGVGLVALGVAAWMYFARPTVQSTRASARTISPLDSASFAIRW